MKNFCEGFCKTTGVIIGFFATIFVLGGFIDTYEKKQKSEAKTEE